MALCKDYFVPRIRFHQFLYQTDFHFNGVQTAQPAALQAAVGFSVNAGGIRRCGVLKCGAFISPKK